MTTQFVGTFHNTYDDKGVGVGAGAEGKGFGEIMKAFSKNLDANADALNAAITASSTNPGDPTTMLKMQVALANYNIGLQVEASVVKAVEETAKSLTQKIA